MKKNILICTQKVDMDDPILGFFHDWILEFSKKYEKVTIICLYDGKHSLPDNVKVLSLGKDKKVSKLKYILNFYKYIWHERKNYDSVFVHMNQIYVILGSIFWRIQSKKTVLWYMHGQTSWSLRFATFLTNYIFTGTENSFPIQTNKKHVFGHGINTNRFPFTEKEFANKLKMIVVGRISRIKKYENIINVLKDFNNDFELKIIGGPVYESGEIYFSDLKKLVSENGLSDKIFFTGPVSNYKILDYLEEADIFVSNSTTGSLDKAVLEAMSVGCIPITCNRGISEALGEYQNLLTYNIFDTNSLKDKLQEINSLSMEEKKIISRNLSQLVAAKHSLPNLIEKIFKIL